MTRTNIKWSEFEFIGIRTYPAQPVQSGILMGTSDPNVFVVSLDQPWQDEDGAWLRVAVLKPRPSNDGTEGEDGD